MSGKFIVDISTSSIFPIMKPISFIDQEKAITNSLVIETFWICGLVAAIAVVGVESPELFQTRAAQAQDVKTLLYTDPVT